jgi:hypothetical protein
LLPSILFHWQEYRSSRPVVLSSVTPGERLEEKLIMDKVVSLLISVGIIAFGAWVAAATTAKGWPLVWTLMALFPL